MEILQYFISDIFLCMFCLLFSLLPLSHSTFMFFQVPFFNASKLHWNTSAVSLKSSFLNIFYTNCQSHWMCRFHLDPAIRSWAIPLPFALWQEALNTIVDKGQLCFGGNYWIWKTSVMLKVFKGRKMSFVRSNLFLSSWSFQIIKNLLKIAALAKYLISKSWLKVYTCMYISFHCIESIIALCH